MSVTLWQKLQSRATNLKSFSASFGGLDLGACNGLSAAQFQKTTSEPWSTHTVQDEVDGTVHVEEQVWWVVGQHGNPPLSWRSPGPQLLVQADKVEGTGEGQKEEAEADGEQRKGGGAGLVIQGLSGVEGASNGQLPDDEQVTSKYQNRGHEGSQGRVNPVPRPFVEGFKVDWLALNATSYEHVKIDYIKCEEEMDVHQCNEDG